MRAPFKKTYIITAIFLIVIFIFHYLGWLRPLENILRSLFVPSLSKTHGLNIKLNNEFQFFQNPEQFIDQYQKCIIQLQDRDTLESRVHLLEKENDELKKQLNFINQQSSSTVLAQVVGNDLVGVEKIIIINVGSRSNIKLNQPAIIGNGILIGKVIKVEDTISIVRLISDTQSKIQGTILNSEQSFGVIEGGYGLSLRVQFVPRNELVHINEQVVTSGLEKNIPRGLFIGRVVEVENEAYQGFQRISVIPAADLSKLTMVSILLTD